MELTPEEGALFDSFLNYDPNNTMNTDTELGAVREQDTSSSAEQNLQNFAYQMRSNEGHEHFSAQPIVQSFSSLEVESVTQAAGRVAASDELDESAMETTVGNFEAGAFEYPNFTVASGSSAYLSYEEDCEERTLSEQDLHDILSSLPAQPIDLTTGGNSIPSTNKSSTGIDADAFTSGLAPSPSIQSSRMSFSQHVGPINPAPADVQPIRTLQPSQVVTRLGFVREDTKHQPAQTVFGDSAAAKKWRKRQERNAQADAEDEAFPNGSGEEREYVKMLVAAFKYRGTDCRYNQQDLQFVTNLVSNRHDQQIEAWCWQVLKHIIRRQTTGRPFDLAKRKKSPLDPDDLNFAERFSDVFNAIKFEKRCCIRFANMEGWHKRIANDPLSEVAEIVKNDNINDKKAAEKKAKKEEAEALAKALGEEKAKSLSTKSSPKKRGIASTQDDCDLDSPSYNTPNSTISKVDVSQFSRPIATQKRRSTGKGSRVQAGKGNLSRRKSAAVSSIASSQYSATPVVHPSKQAGSENDMFGPGPMLKKLRITDGSPRTKEGLGRSTSRRESMSSVGISRPSPLRLEALNVDYFGRPSQPIFASSLHTSPISMSSPYESPSPRAETQYQRQRARVQHLPEVAEELAPSANQEDFSLNPMLAVDARMHGIYFTQQQHECARRVGMETHEYVNFARVLNGMPEID